MSDDDKKAKKNKFAKLSPEDQKILDWMNKNRRSNGDIGYALEDGPEAVEWLRYYQRKYPHKVPFMLSQLKPKANGKPNQYLVPAQWPVWFDPSWAPMPSRRQSIYPKLPSQSSEERSAAVDSILKRFRGTATGQEAEKNP